jgi:hypothetical protein
MLRVVRDWAAATGGPVGLISLGILAAFPSRWLGIGMISLGLVWLAWNRYRRRAGSQTDDASQRQELREWLIDQIDKLERWRVELDEEMAKSTPNFDRIRKIESRFWEKSVPDITDRLELSEWGDFWERTPDSFHGALVSGSATDIAELSQFVAWSAVRLRDIEEKLRA